MKDDIRYSEFLFLCALERNDSKFAYVSANSQEQRNILALGQLFYMQVMVTLAEDGYVTFQQQNLQLLIGRLRGEIDFTSRRRGSFNEFVWDNPRDALQSELLGAAAHQLGITYRGLRRIEELRELLKRDRILEHFGVLLDMVYPPRSNSSLSFLAYLGRWLECIGRTVSTENKMLNRHMGNCLMLV